MPVKPPTVGTAAETLGSLVQRMSQRLAEGGVAFGQGTLNARDEAAWLTLWSLGLALDALDDRADQALSAAEVEAVQRLIERRISSRQPAAYLTGEAWLQGVPFHIDPRAIVPRSLIAEPLAEGSIDPWLSDHTRRVLDLCTGNGSLAVLAALAWPEVSVDATDLSADALAVAERNVRRHDLQARIQLRQGDGWDAVPGQCYDLVMCNPPYVNQASMAALPPEFRAEPTLALAGGLDGMDFIRKLIAGLPQHLSDAGVLVLEIGHEWRHFERAFAGLEVVGLPTSVGDEQVLLVTAGALADWLARG